MISIDIAVLIFLGAVMLGAYAGWRFCEIHHNAEWEHEEQKMEA